MPISDVPPARGADALAPADERLVVGIFVGGASRRMGAVKGLLFAPGEERTLVERLRDVAHEGLPGAEVVLVGERADYASLGLRTLVDAESGVGPLGGLVALLRYARAQRASGAVALSCDLPYLSSALLGRLGARSDAGIVAPRLDERGGKWQPLAARYSLSVLADCEAALRAGRRSLQPLLDVHARALELSAAERAELIDWDTPEDVSAARSPK